jgi:Flp pilus assembly CpaF family ATPase
MSRVELSPTLVSRLGVLESHVLDPEVSEVLVAGPNSLWITRDGQSERLEVRLDEGTIRSLASRVSRTLAWKDSRSTRSGMLSPELFVSVVGTPRGERCPVLRFVRRTVPRRTLNQLAVDGVLDRDAELRLLQACRRRRSIVISGHPGSGRTELLAALARVWKEERRVAVLDAPEGMLAAADVGHVTLEPSVGAEGAALLGAEVIVADDPTSVLWSQLLGFGRPFLATVEAADAQAALDRIVALCLAEDPGTSQVAGTALVESSVGLVVEMERANGRATVRSIAEPEQMNGHLSARQLMRPLAEIEGPPMSRTPDLPSRPGKEASELRSVAAFPREPTASFLVDNFGFETSDISEIRAESLMSASFVGRLPEIDAPKPEPPEETKPRAQSASERVPTLIGPADVAELQTLGGAEKKKLGAMVPALGEDDTHPPSDERTMHAEAGEMTLEPLGFPDNSAAWSESPSEVTGGAAIDDEPDDTESKGFANEHTPYSPFADQKKETLTDEEIEGMLSDLDEVVQLGDDDGPKAKRRTRKAR